MKEAVANTTPEPSAHSWEQTALLADTSSRPITHRDRFLRACFCQPLNHPPIWMMRQAGRALPEYRALKETHSFLELVQTPELAAEVTLQPIRRFNFDAAILFSDILVVPEAMGQPYRFRDGGGVQMDFAVQTAGDIGRLQTKSVRDRLQYTCDALRLLRKALAGRHALIGFAGSPWTLANFMIDGGSVKEHTGALEMFRYDRRNFDRLCEKLAEAVTELLQMQIEAGADAVQIFDSHGGLLSGDNFEAASGRWIKQIISALHPPQSRAGVPPVIVFSKGAHANWHDLVGTGAHVLGVDHAIRLADVRREVPGSVALQGNLEPNLLVEGTPETVARETRRLLHEMHGRNGYIFNLGHGMPPGAQLENIQAVINTVRNPS